MESIAGKSTFLRASRHLALVGMVAAGLSGCAHDATDDYAAYLDGNEGEFPFSQTGYEAQYYIAPQVRNHTYSFSSAMAGGANIWNVQFGTVLADTLESDDYRAAFTTLSEARETTLSEGLLFKYERAFYRFINNRAEITLHIIVDRDGQQILNKKYSRNGISQTGKMFWGGVFTMDNAIQQSTKSALDQILTDSLADFQVAMKKPIEAPQTALAASASAGAATTLPGAGGEQKQASEASTGRVQDTVADSKAVAESLAALKILHEQGVLGDEEYKQKQREIIDGGLSTGRKQDAAADGKAVAESLAALKILHDQGVLSDEEYMQKQRGIINEHTRKLQASLRGEVPLTTANSNVPQEVSPSGATAAATVTVAAVKDESESELSESTRGTRSIGLLPMKLLSSSHLTHMALEFEAGRELQTLLAKAVDIKVEYSAYDGNSTASLDTETLWEAQLFHPNVREEQLRRLGERLGVDYVVTAWLGTGRASGTESITPWPLDLFVLRVRDGELRVFKTNNKSLGPVVQELIAFIRL